MAWPDGRGVVELPDGTRLRGRGWHRFTEPAPDWGLFVLGRRPRPVPWPSRWVRWPDFRLPRDDADARDAFAEAHRRAAAGERVEVVCAGGRGRTGTALACIAQLGGVPPDEAVAWIRAHYDRHAVERRVQARYVAGCWRT